MNNRRKLLIALSAGALVVPLHSFAQQQDKVWRMGILGSTSASAYEIRVEALRARLRELGYVEGKNLVIERRFAGGQYERMPALAAELVRLKVDVIVTSGTGTSAAQKATTKIPIVMAAQDPIGSGFAKSLARPGGNVTGISNLAFDLGPKHVEMLVRMVPKLSRVAVLAYPGHETHTRMLKNIQAVAQRTNVKVLAVEARTTQEIENAFSVMTREQSGAVIVLSDTFFFQQRRQIAALAAQNRLPTMFTFREHVEAGGLMSYGANLTDNWRLLATYVDKILKGAKPGDLPIEQTMRFDMVINGKTAKALGLTIPQSLLVSADKVLE